MSLVDDLSTSVLEVLLVEDDDGDALLVREILADSDLQAEVSRATTLAEARAMLTERGFDCVLVDLHLPDADDLQAVEEILDGRRDAPVIVLTGLDDRATGIAAVSAGADDYLVKTGVDDMLLAKSMRYALERRRSARASLRLLEAELRRAENLRLERGLLPSPVLSDPRLRFETFYRPGGGGLLLGGDFIDLVERADGTVRLVIGDVCGHGPDEAALGACLRIGWRTLVLAGTPDREVLPLLDQLLRTERNTDLFVTVADLSIDATRRRMTYRLAGHWPPILLAGGCEVVANDERGLPLGIPGGSWGEHHLELPETWELLVYTDGLIEGRRRDGQLLGLEGLCELLDDAGGEVDGDALVARVEELNGGPIVDDVALGALTWRGTAGS
jgi:serine phosphatase RsbU (regulator of sigma subunit)